jgi:hypothetical protein
MSILPLGLTASEIRVLQEYRRITATELTMEAIKAIKHPYGGGEAPAFGLVEKGYLTAENGGQTFALTEQAREFLAYDPVPEFEGA